MINFIQKEVFASRKGRADIKEPHSLRILHEQPPFSFTIGSRKLNGTRFVRDGAGPSTAIGNSFSLFHFHGTLTRYCADRETDSGSGASHFRPPGNHPIELRLSTLSLSVWPTLWRMTIPVFCFSYKMCKCTNFARRNFSSDERGGGRGRKTCSEFTGDKRISRISRKLG